MEIVKAHTRASDLKIPEILPQVGVPKVESKGPAYSVVEEATGHETMAFPTLFDGAQTPVRTTTGGNSISPAVVLNAKYAGWMCIGFTYTRSASTAEVRAGVQWRQIGWKDVTVQYTNASGVDVNHVAVTMPFGEESTFVNLIDNPIPVGSKRLLRFVVANSYLDTHEFQGSEITVVMAQPT